MYVAEPIPVASRFKGCVCGRSLVGIAGSNPSGWAWMSVSCECRADHSSGRVIQGVGVSVKPNGGCYRNWKNMLPGLAILSYCSPLQLLIFMNEATRWQ